MIIACLTTIPERISNIGPIIQSIRIQTLKPDIIYLSIPYKSLKGKEYDIPEFILNDTSVTVLRYDEDLGPGTKLLYPLKQVLDPNAYLITFDDDIIYPPFVIEKLINKSLIYPDCAIGFAGWNTDTVIKGKDYNLMYEGIMPFNGVLHVNILEGWTGALYKPRFFDETIFDIPRDNKMIYTDDVWFSGKLALKCVNKLVTRIYDYQTISINDRYRLWTIQTRRDQKYSGLSTTKDFYTNNRNNVLYFDSNI